jgi:putative aldouronate transport system permease protein
VDSLKIRKKRNWRKQIRQSLPLYFLLLPAVTILICFTYFPLYGLTIAFKDFSPVLGITNSPWVGMKYFVQFFNSYQFYDIIKNTLTISIYGIVVGFPLPILLAILCHQLRNGRFKKVFQIITYLPHFISIMVICGMILIFLSPSSGLFANILKQFSIKMPNILAFPSAFSSVIVWSDVWQHIGWDSIIYLAALAGIDPSLYEAAKMDGASRFQQMTRLDIPLILPTAMTLLILRAGSILNVGFEKVFLLQNKMNISASEIISTHVYKLGLINSQYSLSAAVGLFNTIINLLILLIVNRISKRLTNTTLF